MYDLLLQQKAAATILDRGVKICIIKTPLRVKLRGLFRLKVVVHQPTLRRLMRISEIIIKMNLTSEQLQKVNIVDSFYLLNGTAELACEAIAIALQKDRIPQKRLAKLLLDTLTSRDFARAWEIVLLHTGVADFIDTIRSISQRMMYLSPKSRGSQQKISG